MDVAALIVWIVTALGGFYLLGTWLTKGGVRQQREGGTRFAPGLIFGHPALAALGLVIWIAYMISDEAEALAWIAFALLIPVALLGFTMFLRWLGDRRSAHRDLAGGDVPAERRLAPAVVAAHGVLAVATVVIVLLAAIDASG